MLLLTLKLGDGLSSGRPWLRSQVMLLQAALDKSGAKLAIDGLFGSGTAAPLKEFQQNQGLPVNAVCDAKTWAKLMPFLEQAEGAFWSLIQQYLAQFEGDLGFIHLWEGYRGYPYWPGGVSGVTLDPGVDLGQTTNQVVDNYKNIVSAAQWSAVLKVLKITGQAANAALQADPVLQSIRISDEQAKMILPITASSYWNEIAKRFAVLKQAGTPGSVQTALLSLAYNRGPNNAGLNVLNSPLAQGQWTAVGEAIMQMQQGGDTVAGIQQRRQAEGKLILTEMGMA